MSSQYLIKDKTLTEIADAIRSKSGETGAIKTDNFADKIMELEVTASGPNFVQATGDGCMSHPDYIYVAGVDFVPKTIVATNARQLYEFEDGTAAVGGYFYAAMNLAAEKGFDDSQGWVVAAPKSNSGTIHILQESYNQYQNIPSYDPVTKILILPFGVGNSTDHGGEDVELTSFIVRIYG